ncbi:unnamed protein product [Spirodela intermedia]|uniref:BHLH domain-containing protein n=1 Tax=Spirodela intermedia TaxID=51605 RepID=A0A7I8JSV4_SPIIN|nr:unnamed protein product [Spirodela intermedia]CAA6673204.1 unnamed protein product [Spirodela intermedia]
MAELAEDFGSFRTLATLMGLDPSFDLIDDFSTAIENPSFHLRSFSDNSFSLPSRSNNCRRRTLRACLGARRRNALIRFQASRFSGEEKAQLWGREACGVVHVRAKRGQATDRHSLAERVRREKINEKMRRLQTLVPGCYKAMGTTVMLDEIINYVRSLQNQVEFLSMKLSAAAALCDFTLSEADLAAAVGHHADYQVQEMDGLMIREYEGLGGIEAAIPF